MLNISSFPLLLHHAKVEKEVATHNESVAGMQMFTSQILESHLSLQSGRFNYLSKIRDLSLDGVQFKHIKYPQFMLIRLGTSAEETPKE